MRISTYTCHLEEASWGVSGTRSSPPLVNQLSSTVDPEASSSKLDERLEKMKRRLYFTSPNLPVQVEVARAVKLARELLAHDDLPATTKIHASFVIGVSSLERDHVDRMREAAKGLREVRYAPDFCKDFWELLVWHKAREHWEKSRSKGLVTEGRATEALVTATCNTIREEWAVANRAVRADAKSEELREWEDFCKKAPRTRPAREHRPNKQEQTDAKDALQLYAEEQDAIKLGPLGKQEALDLLCKRKHDLDVERLLRAGKLAKEPDPSVGEDVRRLKAGMEACKSASS